MPRRPVEAIFTVAEETDLPERSELKRRTSTAGYVNLDSEEEGVFYIGCAGGVGTNVHMDVVWEETLPSLGF